MKICHEVNQLDIGGVEKIVRNIIKYDHKNEHIIITYRDGAYRQELEKVGAKIHVLGSEKDEADFDADVIHVHTGGDKSRLAEFIKLQVPVIETIHSPVRSVISSGLVSQRVGVCGIVARMNNNAISINNGIDIADVQNTKSAADIRDELGIDINAVVVGRLGRLGRDKGIEEWLLTIYRLQQKGHQIVPLIVGSTGKDEEKYFGRLKLMAESLPVKNIVWVPNILNIYDYLQIMDIFLYPSPTEGFGLVFAEAMLAGCCVVTYNTPVTLELFGGYAILTKQSIDGLVEGVDKALNPHFRVAFNGVSNKFVEAEYDAQRMSEEYQELYERCNANTHVSR